MPVPLAADLKILEISRLLQEVEKAHHVSTDEALLIVKGIRIPLSGFQSPLSGFEIIVKHLHEHLKLDFSLIGRLTGRTRQAVWITYTRAQRKLPEALPSAESVYDFPLSELASQKPILVTIVKFLKEKHQLSYAEIARLLGRDQRTIWTTYHSGAK